MGVAAGLADYTGVDPTLFRLGFVAATLLTGPVMVLLYIVAGLSCRSRSVDSAAVVRRRTD